MCPTGCEDWFDYEERAAQQERYERQRQQEARFYEYSSDKRPPVNKRWGMEIVDE